MVSVVEYHGEALLPRADIVVSTIHPLVVKTSVSKHIPKELYNWFNSFGTVIYDEIHLFGSPLYSEVFNMIRARHQLGLSATPERSDGMKLYYILKVGPTLDTTKELGIKPPKFDVAIITANPSTSPVAIGGYRSYAKNVLEVTINESRYIDLRNRLADFFRKHPDRNILIFCNYHLEVEWLYPKLARDFMDRKDEVYGIKRVGKAYGSMPAVEIAHEADHANILICTYRKGGTGFSPIRFTVAVIYSPTRALITQAIGRIQRWVDDQKHNELRRYIIDYVDTNTVCSSQYYRSSFFNNVPIPSRRKVYLDNGYTFINRKKKSKHKDSINRIMQQMREIGL